MPEMGKSEAEFEALVRATIEGLRNNPDLFPNPPLSVEQLQAKLDAYIALRKDEARAFDVRDRADAAQANALRGVIDAMMPYPDCGAVVGGYDDDPELMRERDRRTTPPPLQPPGQTRALGIARKGADWLYLDWKAPSDGGAVAYYRVERRDAALGGWMSVARTMDRDATLGEQVPGKAWEYRVIAVNAAGQGEASTTVAVGL